MIHTPAGGEGSIPALSSCALLYASTNPPSLVTLIIALPADPYAFPQHKSVGFFSAWFLAYLFPTLDTFSPPGFISTV